MLDRQWMLSVAGYFILIGGGLVLVAFLVNRYAPQKRKCIRRLAS